MDTTANDLATSDFAKLERGYAAPFCTGSGVISSALFQPSEYSLWHLSAELAAGAEIAWGAVSHGDEAIYLLDGVLDVQGTPCKPGSAILIEADVRCVARAVTPCRLLHFGPSTATTPTNGLLDPPATTDRVVHIVAAESVSGTGVRFFSDGSCPTCRVAFFIVDLPEPLTVGSHKHSEDEIIHVTIGELKVGRLRVKPGMSIAVPADRRYGFRTDGPVQYLNYRAAPSTVTHAPGSEPELETRERTERLRAMRELGIQTVTGSKRQG